MEKNIGIIGLGKMGGAMARRLRERDWDVVGFDPAKDVRDEIEKDGVVTAESIRELVVKLPLPRLVLIMVPHTVVNDVLADLARSMDKGDTVIDAGNSQFEETVRRGGKLDREGITFIDVGVSGGPSGARNGACLMVGGSKEDFERLAPLYKDLAAPEGFGHFDGLGAGHFVKMVHNGIEYGMMQSIGEGFNVMRASDYDIDLKGAARVYQRESVIESRLIGLLVGGYKKYGVELNKISGSVAHSGEGLWTIQAAKAMGEKVPVIERSLKFREDSQKEPSYTGRVVSVLRNMFGGHDVRADKD